MSKGNQSVERAALILKALSANGSLGVTELAKQIGLPKSITYRLLTSLKEADLVRAVPNGRRYALGYGLLQMASEWVGKMEVRNVAMPYLKKLRVATGETVALNIRDGDCRATVERLDTSFEVRFVVDLGRALPMHIGAAGKAILAFLREDEISEIISRTELSQREAQSLRKNLDEIQKAGFADTSGERVAGSRSISAPIFDHQGHVIASVSLLSLQTRMQDHNIDECRDRVKSTALAISKEMGWTQLSSVA